MSALQDGLRLAGSFNPVTAIAGSVIAAMALSRGDSAWRWSVAVAAILITWFAGDGIEIFERFSGEGTAGAGLLVPLVWAVGGLALGYVLPAWAGAYVGRRVTWGTGWLSAAVVAATVCLAVSRITGALGGAFSIALTP